MTIEAKATRPEMRNPVRGETPRERAAKRAAQVREHIGSLDEGNDEFYIDPNIIPDGWSYEWKNKTVLGAEDPAYAVGLARKGWEPVDASRHPEMMPAGSKDAHILRKGMILMERPAELTDEAKRIENRRARDQVRVKEDQLISAKPGQFERNNKDMPLAKVKKGYEAIQIPE